MRQCRLALDEQGLLDEVSIVISSLPEDQKRKINIEWEYATSVERLSPWVIQLGGALGLNEEKLDELFKTAAEL